MKTCTYFLLFSVTLILYACATANGATTLSTSTSGSAIPTSSVRFNTTSSSSTQTPLPSSTGPVSVLPESSATAAAAVTPTTDAAATAAPAASATNALEIDPENPPYYDPDDGRLLWLIGRIVTCLNALGVSYVILRTYIRWRRSNRSLSMALRIPFYIAVSDFILVISSGANMAFSIEYGRPLSGTPCRIVAGTVFFFMMVNMTLVGTIALVTYLRVCRKVYITFGAYDYKLLVISIAIPLTLTLASISTFGPIRFWCFTMAVNQTMRMAIAMINFFILAMCLFCYICTLREINAIDWSEFREAAEHRNAKVEERVTRKIVAYVLIFVLQWSPAALQAVGHDATWTYIVVICCINFGGIGNATQYVINEGWTDSRYYGSNSNSEEDGNELSPSGASTSGNTADGGDVKVIVT